MKTKQKKKNEALLGPQRPMSPISTRVGRAVVRDNGPNDQSKPGAELAASLKQNDLRERDQGRKKTTKKKENEL